MNTRIRSHRRLPFLTTLLLAVTGVAPAAFADDHDPMAAARAIEAVRPSLVRVEHHLRQHQGERPDLLVSGDPFAIAGSGPRESADSLIGEERPLESPGIVIEPTLVMAIDIPLHERFVDRVRVRHGAAVVDATVESWAVDDSAVFLRLARPLEGTVPVTFAAADATPAWSVRWLRGEGSWVAEARPFSRRRVLTDEGDGRWRETTAAGTLMVNDEGHLVGVSMRGNHPDGRGLFGDPRERPRLDAAARTALMDRTASIADASVVRATLQFRSPRQRGGQARFSPFRAEGDEIGTELQTIAVRLAGGGSPGRAAVLASLPPSATARLESVTLHLADGTALAAEFESTLRDLGVFTVTVPDAKSPDGSPDESGGGIRLSTAAATAWRDRLLPTALIRISGRQRVRELGHARFDRFVTGWRGVVHPAGMAEVDRAFVFAPDDGGAPELVALPLVRRVPAADRDRWRGISWMMTPAAVLAEALAAGESAIDPSNVPLDEEEEARTPWLGVIMQGIEKELADALGVAEITRDGEFGGLVAAVFEDSPAARAGIEPGAVLLAIHSAARPRPIQILVDEMDMGFPGAFPWERLDEVPEEFYDQIPTPWPTVEDLTSRALVELGFGSAFELEFFADGEVRRVPMTVEQSPPHFGNAPRHEEERLGLTVRDLSFEVRTHLRIAPDEPGVVVANLKPGGRASLAGLRPYEIIVEVDGEPVANAAAFGELVKDRNDLRLAVRRGTRSRVVRLSD